MGRISFLSKKSHCDEPNDGDGDDNLVVDVDADSNGDRLNTAQLINKTNCANRKQEPANINPIVFIQVPVEISF